MTVDLRLGRWQDVLADIHDASVRLILTSPPYDNARTYEGTNEPVDFGELARFALRVLMPGGVLAMVLDGAVNDGRQSITPYRVICEWAEMDGWRFRQMLAYGRQGVPGRFPGRFRRDHEPVIVFVRDGGTEVWESARLAERGYYRSAKGRHARGNPSARDKNQDRGRNQGVIDGAVNRGSIWWYGALSLATDASCGTGHPATFAEAFALDAVTVWSNLGDLVVDPFMGSGTVAVACRGLGRHFIGAERVPLYHEIALRRLDPTHISETRAAEPVGPLFMTQP